MVRIALPADRFRDAVQVGSLGDSRHLQKIAQSPLWHADSLRDLIMRVPGQPQPRHDHDEGQCEHMVRIALPADHFRDAVQVGSFRRFLHFEKTPETVRVHPCLPGDLIMRVPGQPQPRHDHDEGQCEHMVRIALPADRFRDAVQVGSFRRFPTLQKTAETYFRATCSLSDLIMRVPGQPQPRHDHDEGDVDIVVMTADRERLIAELRKAADRIARMTDEQWRRIAAPAPPELRPFVVSDFIPLPSTLEDRL